MLQFTVSGQKLTRVDKFEPATDSKAYLQAAFTFSGDWSGATKTAIFRDEVTGESYAAPLNSSGVCTVPAEVLTRSAAVHYQTQGNHFHVSLRGDVGSKLITTNEVKIQLARSGYTDGKTPAAITPDAYSQFVANVATDAAAATASAEAAAESERNVASLYANALKKTVAGEIIRMDDVSPAGHELGVRVRGKNLFNRNKNAIVYGVLMFDVSELEIGKPYVLSSNLPVTWFKISNLPSGHNSVSYSSAEGMTEIKFIMAKNENIPDDAEQYLLLSVDADFANNPVTSVDQLNGYNIQIEAGTEATSYQTPIDPTAVTLTRSGKSVFSARSYDLAKNTAPWTSILLAKIKTGAGRYVARCKYAQVGADHARVALSVRDYDDTLATLGHTDGSAAMGVLTVPFTIPAGKKGFQLYLYSNYSAETLTTDCRFTEIQVEVGESPTSFAAYEGGETFTPAADGTVAGVKSLSPCMTLRTDTPEVTIEATYHRDLVKAIEALEAALIN